MQTHEEEFRVTRMCAVRTSVGTACMPGSVPSSRTQAKPSVHRVDARPPSADAGSVWGSEDVAVAYSRRSGLQAVPGGTAPADGWDHGVALTALYLHRAGAPARDAGHSDSPQPTVCRVGKGSCVG
jgi:hypothetical protein